MEEHKWDSFTQNSEVPPSWNLLILQFVIRHIFSRDGGCRIIEYSLYILYFCLEYIIYIVLKSNFKQWWLLCAPQLSSSHIPMMIIPCGHTLCKACSEGRKTCPSCDCPIVSLTVNIMLQQVIQEYHSHPQSSMSQSNLRNQELGKKDTHAGKYVEGA